MNSKRFVMPHEEQYKAVQQAIWEYYWLCFPEFDEDELHDLTRGPLVEIEDTVRRLVKNKEGRR